MSSSPPSGRPSRPSRPSRLLAGLLVGGALLSACGGAAESAVRAAPSPTPTPSATPPPPPPAPPVKPKPKPPTVNALTGLPPVPTGPAVAVKVDNSPLARPYHRGLGEAALVYQELVESGATRFMAVYNPAVDVEVGPIRSIRETDLELLPQFGRIALAASGANDGVLASTTAAEKAGSLVDVNYEAVRGPYRKGERRADAVNFFASPAALATAKPRVTGAKDVGLRFGPLKAGAGPGTRGQVSFSGRSTADVRYDPVTGRYVVRSDGVRIKDALPANVVVQFVEVQDSGYVDVRGSVTPRTITVGSGDAVVLRDGRQLTGIWSRPKATSGTRLVGLDDKKDLLLKPGPTWFLMVPAGRSLTVG